MNWWDSQDEITMRNLTVGIEYLNRAITLKYVFDEFAEVARALEAFALGYYSGRFGEGLMTTTKNRQLCEEPVSPNRAVRRFVGESLSLADLCAFLQSEAVRKLVDLEPLIYNELQVGAKTQGQGQPVAAGVDAQATAKHRCFNEAWKRADATPNLSTCTAAASNLGALFYLVRNNLNHWGKRRGARDLQVVAITCGAVKDFLKRALATPERVIAVYGTLKRGGEAHHLIEHLGDPQYEGCLRGDLVEDAPYPVFRLDPQKLDIPVEVYAPVDDALWSVLDKYEGEGLAYRRIFAAVKLRDGSHVVASVYAQARSEPQR